MSINYYQTTTNYALIDKYSLIMAILLFNSAMAIAALLRRKAGYLAKYSASALVLLALFGALRVFLPLTFPFAYVHNSWETIPKIAAALGADIWPGANRIALYDVLLVIWGVGSLAMLIRVARNELKERSYRKRYRVSENAQACRVARELGLNRAKITVSPDVAVPYVTGVFTARIYLPRIEMPDDALGLVLKHEYQHFKSRDMLIKAFYALLSILFWWNPIVHIFLRDLDRLLEIRCDEAMTRRMGEDEKTLYLESLLLVAKHIQTKGTAKLAGASAFVKTGQHGVMEQRFLLIHNSRNTKSSIKQIVSIALAVTLFIASFLVVILPAYPPPPMEEGEFTLSPDNSYILVTRDGRYKLYSDGELLSEDETFIEKYYFKDLPIIMGD